MFYMRKGLRLDIKNRCNSIKLRYKNKIVELGYCSYILLYEYCIYMLIRIITLNRIWSRA